MRLLSRGAAEDRLRGQILEAVGSERRSGFEIAELLAAAASPERETAPPEPNTVAERDELALYPTLHRLEAERQLDATWCPDASGSTRRRYRLRRG